MNFARRFGFAFTVLAMLLLAGSNISAQKLRLRGNVNPVCAETNNIISGQFLKFADIYADGNIAVQGGFECSGAFIYDITDPDHPVLASRYNPGNTGAFIEAIVVGHTGYFGSGYGSRGVHIVDLTDPYNPVFLGVVDASHGNGFNNIHEIMIWNNYLIENQQNLISRDLRVIDITNPAAPVFKWAFTPNDPTWVHAMHIRGTRLFTSGWGGQVEMFDISNLANQPPTRIGGILGNNNNHSTWTSEDGNYLYSCRELQDGDLRVYDIHDPANPVLIRSIRAGNLGINAVSPHNPVVVGNILYVAWYQAGLQAFNISDPTNPVRIAQYDTFQQAYAIEPDPKKRSLLATEPWDMICGNAAGLSSLPGTYDGDWAIWPFLGQDKVLAGDLTGGLFVLDATRLQAASRNIVSDFDNDGKTDISVFTPLTGDWNYTTSGGGRDVHVHWGQTGDIIVNGDYDGDGKSDPAVFRPSNGYWYAKLSGGSEFSIPWGNSTDIPVPADYDGDGKTDLAIWRPSTGIWYILQSTLGFRAVQWGANGDKPITGDYEGDGKPDIAVWRPSNGVWYILPSSSSIPMYRQFGANGDKPLFGDFDGNGISDLAVYRPSNGNWYYMDPATQAFHAMNFGITEDIPIPADYDGDGEADIAVYRPSTSYWYHLDSSSGTFQAMQYGQGGDRPSPSSVQPQ
jgi:hypothetical protein